MSNNEFSENIEEIESEIEDQSSSAIQYELLTYPADFTLEVLYQKLKNKDIIIPPLERLFVWTQNQASRLIESFLIGLPVPPIFLYDEKDSGRLLVVDGQQRLKSIAFYFEGLFGEIKGSSKRTPFTLNINDEKSPWYQKAFDQLTEEEQRKLKNCVLRAFIMKQTNPNDQTSIYHVFERLNTGGTLLNNQEIRNCIYSGSFNDLLKDLNRNKNWRNILGKEEPDKRLKDIEFILRFLALFEESNKYRTPMKNFLNNFMSKQRNGKENSRFNEIFIETVESVYNSLGEKPFNIRAGFNVAVFDSIFVSFAKNIKKVKYNMSDIYKDLIKNKVFLELTRSNTTDEEVVKRRISIAENILFK